MRYALCALRFPSARKSNSKGVLMREVVKTTQSPAAVGPYSQGIKISGGNLLFTAGQVALDPATGQMIAGDIKAQTMRTLENVKAFLTAAGSSLGNVVKATVF